MVGVGIDLGTAFAKGVALRRLEDGSLSVLAATAAPVEEARSRPAAFILPLARHRPTPFTRASAVTCCSSADAFLDRLRLPLPPETGFATGLTVAQWIYDGRIGAPAGTQVADDLWDFLPLQFFRRSSDVEQMGRKVVDGLFARLPEAVARANAFRFKPLQDGGLEPAAVALLNAALRFVIPVPGQPVLVCDLGAAQIQALLIQDGALVRAVTLTVGDLAAQVERLARLDAGQGHARLKNSDLSASDAASAGIRDTISRGLQKVRSTLWEGGAAPRPARALLAGGLGITRGASRIASAALEVATDTLPPPEGAGGGFAWPAPYPLFAGALGAALKAAGDAPVPLMPRRHVPRPHTAKGGKLPFSLPHLPHLPSLPHLPHLSQLQQLAHLDQLAQLAHLAHLPHLSSLEPRTIATRAGERVAGALRWARALPQRLGWAWVAVGAAAALAMVPTLAAMSRAAATRAELVQEIEVRRPDSEELAREARVVREYAELTGSGQLTILPLGEILAEIAARMPGHAFIARLSANRDRLNLIGSLKGTLKEITDRLKDAPALKRAGYRLE